jgi:GR25 family glycosyltransferase involved in LPS biosynthesis
MKKILIAKLLVSFAILNADISQYFKKPLNKTPNSIRNIDFIYVINLDKRPEKFAHCVQELAPYNIHPYRFSAVNGWELTLETINKLGVRLKPGMDTSHMGTCYLTNEPHHEQVHKMGRTYFCHCMSRGAIGIAMSHLSILQDAYDSGYETIWVMEDDIQVIRSPLLLPDLIDELDETVGKQHWDILFTDRDTKNQQGKYVPCTGYGWKPNYTPRDRYTFRNQWNISSTFRQIGARFGAYSMIVRRSGMRKILDYMKQYKIFLPFDIEFAMPPDIRLFTVQKDVVSTLPNALSDNGGANYIKN